MTKEITIAGGGLAGLSLAVALRLRGVPVTVVEAGRYPRHRVCGEFISGVSAETLDFLGIRDLLEDAGHHRTLCWHEQGRELHRDTLPEPAYGISRFVLDERLRARVEALGGNIREGERARPLPEEGLVWAAGRRPCHGPWIGLKAHLRGLPMRADLEMHSGSNGYAGMAAVEDGWVNVCGLFRLDRAIKGKGHELLASYLHAGGSRGLAKMVGSAECRADSFTAVAGFKLGRQSPLPGLLCLGDAESMIPPFTGNGMSMAFQSAEIACDVLVSWSRGEIPWRQAMDETRCTLVRRFRKRLAAAGALHPVLFRASGRTLLKTLSSTRLLPFRPMLSLVR